MSRNMHTCKISSAHGSIEANCALEVLDKSRTIDKLPGKLCGANTGNDDGNATINRTRDPNEKIAYHNQGSDSDERQAGR